MFNVLGIILMNAAIYYIIEYYIYKISVLGWQKSRKILLYSMTKKLITAQQKYRNKDVGQGCIIVSPLLFNKKYTEIYLRKRCMVLMRA